MATGTGTQCDGTGYSSTLAALLSIDVDWRGECLVRSLSKLPLGFPQVAAMHGVDRLLGEFLPTNDTRNGGGHARVLGLLSWRVVLVLACWCAGVACGAGAGWPRACTSRVRLMSSSRFESKVSFNACDTYQDYHMLSSVCGSGGRPLISYQDYHMFLLAQNKTATDSVCTWPRGSNDASIASHSKHFVLFC